MPTIEGTLSAAGLRFANDFPEGTRAIPWVPASIRFPGGRSLTVNDASAGPALSAGASRLSNRFTTISQQASDSGVET